MKAAASTRQRIADATMRSTYDLGGPISSAFGPDHARREHDNGRQLARRTTRATSLRSPLRLARIEAASRT